jgi:hypothetical protein
MSIFSYYGVFMIKRFFILALFFNNTSFLYAQEDRFEQQELEFIQKRVDDLFFSLMDFRTDMNTHYMMSDRMKDPLVHRLFQQKAPDNSYYLPYYLTGELRRKKIYSFKSLSDELKEWLTSPLDEDIKSPGSSLSKQMKGTQMMMNNVHIKVLTGEHFCQTDDGLRDACYYQSIENEKTQGYIYFKKDLFHKSSLRELLGLYLHELGHSLQGSETHQQLAKMGEELTAFYFDSVRGAQTRNSHDSMMREKSKDSFLDLQIQKQMEGEGQFFGALSLPTHIIVKEMIGEIPNQWSMFLTPSFFRVNESGTFSLQTGFSLASMFATEYTTDLESREHLITEETLQNGYYEHSITNIIFSPIPLLSPATVSIFKDQKNGDLHWGLGLIGVTRSSTIRKNLNHYLHYDFNLQFMLGNSDSYLTLASYLQMLYLYVLPENPLITSIGGKIMHSGNFFFQGKGPSSREFVSDMNNTLNFVLGFGGQSEVLVLGGLDINATNIPLYTLGLQYRF